MATKIQTLQRNIRIHERYHQLYRVERKRLDDTYRQLEEEFFLTGTTLQRILTGTSIEGLKEQLRSIEPIQGYVPRIATKGSCEDVLITLRHIMRSDELAISAAEMASEIEYERQHKNRFTVLQALERALRKLMPLLLLLIMAGSMAAQSGSYLKRSALSLGLAFASGAADGVSQDLLWHYEEFQATFPAADAGYWDPRKSWTRKYKQGNPALGAAYPGSTTLLAWTTDGYHLMRTGSRMTMITAFTMNGMRARNWKELLLGSLLHAAVWSAGFHLTYSLIIRKQP